MTSMFEVVGKNLQMEFQMLTKSHCIDVITEFTGQFSDMHRSKQITTKRDTWLPQKHWHLP